MKCPHCGEDLPDGFVYIPPTENKEEAPVQSPETETPAEEFTEPAAEATEIQPMPNPAQIIQYSESQPRKSKKAIAAVAGAAVIIAAAAGISGGISHHAAAVLREDMTGTWQSSGDLITTAQLTVTGDTISYSETFGFMEMNNFTYPYKATAKDTIKIQGKTFKVSLDKNNGTMTITPGLAGGSTEVWYAPSALRPGDDTSGENTDDGTASNGVL